MKIRSKSGLGTEYTTVIISTNYYRIGRLPSIRTMTFVCLCFGAPRTSRTTHSLRAFYRHVHHPPHHHRCTTFRRRVPVVHHGPHSARRRAGGEPPSAAAAPPGHGHGITIVDSTPARRSRPPRPAQQAGPGTFGGVSLSGWLVPLLGLRAVRREGGRVLGQRGIARGSTMGRARVGVVDGDGERRGFESTLDLSLLPRPR
jgi:hypothetical protein